MKDVVRFFFFSKMFGSSQDKDVFLHDNQIYFTHILKSLYVLGYLSVMFMEFGISKGENKKLVIHYVCQREYRVFETYLHCRLFTVYLKFKFNWVFCIFIC